MWVTFLSAFIPDTYDRDLNRTARTNTVNRSFNESYGYDDLNQLTGFARGSHTPAWDLDATGNFETVTTNGGSPPARMGGSKVCVFPTQTVELTPRTLSRVFARR